MAYLNRDKYYYMGGQSMVQGLEPKNKKKDYLAHMKEDESQMIGTGLDNPPQKVQHRAPVLLDKDVFDFLKEENYKSQKIKTNSSDYLIKIYDMMKIKVKDMVKKEKEEQKMTQTGMTVKSKEAQDRLYKTQQFKDSKQLKHQAEEQKKYENRIKAIVSYRREDVYHTLQVYQEQARQQEIKDIEKRKNDRMLQDIGKSIKEEKKSFNQETLKRLYPENNFGVSKASKQEQFMKRLHQIFYENRYSIDYGKLHDNVNDIDVYIKFWNMQDLSNEPILNIQNMQASIYIEDYFSKAAKTIISRYQGKYGLVERNAKKLVQFYRKDQKLNLQEIQANNKKNIQNPLYFDFQDDKRLMNLLNRYFDDNQRELDNRTFKEQQLQKQKEKMMEDKKRKLSKRFSMNTIDRLKKPKDRLVLGKTLLNLKSLYPMDSVLTKMIVQEFKNTKLTKYAEEYEQFDSEEEEKVQGISRGFPTSKNPIRDQLKEKEKEIIQYFHQDIQDYHQKREEKRQRKEMEIKKQQLEDKKVNRMIYQSAMQFIELRKKRFERKVPTIHEYMLELYDKLYSNYMGNVQRRFIMIRWRRIKKREQMSYPLKLKRYFFEVVRTIIKSTMKQPRDKKLAFWAPTSKHEYGYRVFLNGNSNQQTHNKKIWDKCENKKQEKIMDSVNNKTVWEDKNIMKERLKIMMRYEDAQQCIFQPMISYRVPTKIKDDILAKSVSAVAKNNIMQQTTNFDKWVERMGNNFEKRFPVIYKYGVYRMSLQCYKKGNYIESYSKLSSGFRINDVVKFFDADKVKKYNEDSIYSKYYQDEKALKHVGYEDFESKKSVKFLKDVYDLIQALEEYDENYQKVKKNIEKMLVEDQKSMSKIGKEETDKEGTKTADVTMDEKRMEGGNRRKMREKMCPLKEMCPDDSRPRWPSSNRKTNSALGGECPYAHHVYELRFRKEMKSRKQLLTNMLKNLNKKISDMDQVQKPWNPAGGIFTDCIGCGEQLMTKDSKGNCNTCQLRKTMQSKLEKYRVKARLKYVQITKKNTFMKQQFKTIAEQQRLQFKIKLVNKANIFYKKQRYVDAFEQICQAIIIVKQELIEADKYRMKNNKKLKRKMHIDDNGIKIDRQLVYKIQRGKSVELGDQKAQTILLYAKKAGIAEDSQSGNVNEYINYQIEQLYYQIEVMLMKTKKDSQRLNDRIENLESMHDQTKFTMCKQNSKCQHYQIYQEKQELLKGNKTIYQFRMYLEKNPDDYKCCMTKVEGCRNKQECIMKMKPCCWMKLTGCVHYEQWKKNTIKQNKQEYREWSQSDNTRQIIKHVRIYAHKPNQLELVSNETKIDNMENTIKLMASKINEAPQDWNYISRNDRIPDMEEMNREKMIKETMKGRKMEMEQSLYDKDIQVVATMPQNRRTDC